MAFTSGIPRAPIFRPSESSRLTTARSRNGIGRAWKQQRELTDKVNGAVGVASQVRQQLRRVQPQQPGLSGMYPFKIYQFPQHLRRHQNDDDWRRVKVRNGKIRAYDSESSGGPVLAYTVYGSDNNSLLFSETFLDFQSPPTDDSAVIVDSWNEAVIPEDGHTYDIWFSFIDGENNTSPTFASGLFYGHDFSTDGTDGTAIQLYDGNTCTPISYRGYTDRYNIRIGSVYASLGVLRIDQDLFANPLIAENPFHPGVGRWMGAYDLNHIYYVGDMVYLDDSGSSSHDFRTVWIYHPPSILSSYHPYQLMGPMRGTSPIGHSPDPWFRLSRSPIATTGSDPAWTSGGYDASKFYIRAS